MTYYVSSGTLNPTHSPHMLFLDTLCRASGGCPVLCSGKNLWTNIHRCLDRGRVTENDASLPVPANYHLPVMHVSEKIVTCSVLTSLPVSTSHSLAVVSMLAVPTYVLCGLNVTPTCNSNNDRNNIRNSCNNDRNNIRNSCSCHPYHNVNQRITL